MENTKLEALIAAHRRGLDHLAVLPLSEDDLPDAIGLLHEVERKAKAIRKGWEAECEAGTVGRFYLSERENKADRTYNSAEIVRRVVDQGGYPGELEALMDLRIAGVVKLEWGWTALRKFLADKGVELEIAAREIEDAGELGGPMVGEVWKRKVRVVPKEEA